MRTRTLTLLLLLAAAAAAQSSSGYFFGGPAAETCCGSTMLHVGAGAEGIIGKGFALGLEGGVFGPAQALHESVLTIAPGLGYHFGRGRARLDPFLAGGYTLAFRGGAANLFYFGGGANYWFSRKVGLRLEFRDMVLRDYHTYHFVGLRAAIAIR